MPVYLRSKIAFTPSSMGEFPPDENFDADFLQDPDQIRDELPQPFRMISKALNTLIDTAWEIIDSREQKRVAEATKIRPPEYECSVSMQEHGSVCCMASSPDGAIVVLGTSSGLSVIDAVTHQTLGSLETGTKVLQVQVSQLSDEVHMVASVDDAGNAELFVVSAGKIFQCEKLNEQQEERPQMLGHKCVASLGGDYVGVYMETSDSKEGVLEIHKITKDVILKELEQGIAKLAARATPHPPGDQAPGSPAPQTEGSSIEISHPPDGPTSNEEPVDEDQSSQVSGTPKPGSPRPPDNPTIKFTPSSVILKVKPPTAVQGVNWKNAQELLKTMDNSDVLGSGANHQVSLQHLSQRHEDFKNMHKYQWPFLPKSSSHDSHMNPTFHFLNAGRLFPQGLDSTAVTAAGQPNSIALWWHGHHQVAFYSLVKQSKDLEHKPDLVWPLANDVIASAVSLSTSLMAFGLRDGHLVIWDKYLGMQRRQLEVAEDNDIMHLSFLDPRVCPQEVASYPPYDTRTNCYVFVWCRSGRLLLVNCGLWNSQEPQDVSAEIETDDDQYCQVIPIQGIPELALTCRHNGALYIHDILDGRVLCQVKLPSPYQLQLAWEPVVAIGAQGQMLYIKGATPESEDPEATGSSSCVFVFQLRSFPTLDSYRTLPRPVVAEVVHNTVEHRVNALLAERMTQQVLRKSRMQDRWSKMKDELELMKKARNSMNAPRSRAAFTVSTIERSIVNSSPQKSLF